MTAKKKAIVNARRKTKAASGKVKNAQRKLSYAQMEQQIAALEEKIAMLKGEGQDQSSKFKVQSEEDQSSKFKVQSNVANQKHFEQHYCAGGNKISVICVLKNSLIVSAPM